MTFWEFLNNNIDAISSVIVIVVFFGFVTVLTSGWPGRRNRR